MPLTCPNAGNPDTGKLSVTRRKASQPQYGDLSDRTLASSSGELQRQVHLESAIQP
jgi:hypothetical protein